MMQPSVLLRPKDMMYNSASRPLKRSIQSNLEDGLAELILNEEPQNGDVIHVSLKPSGDGLQMKIER